MPATASAIRVRVGCLLTAGAFALAACSSAAGAGSTGPSWKPKPSFSGEGYNPPQQQPAQPADPNASPNPSPGSSSPGKKAGDAAVVATRLKSPVGIAILPDNTALVGERTTGRIVRVQPQAGKPVQTVRTIPGIDASGDGGLLDLALSPNYSQDNLIFAYITTRTDNRVVDFTLKGPITPVLTGIPRGAHDNSGRIAFAADGSLLVGTGDAGHPGLAADPKSLAGKILRVTDIGGPAQGNPVRGSRIYASGLADVVGLCTGAKLGNTLIVSSRPDLPADPVYQLAPKASYGWPAGATTSAQPVKSLPTADRDPGGCALLQGIAYLPSRDGQVLLAAPVKVTKGKAGIGSYGTALRKKYGRLRNVVAAPDGALWLTTSNLDGKGKPVPTDDRVIRIVPTGGGGGGASKV